MHHCLLSQVRLNKILSFKTLWISHSMLITPIKNYLAAPKRLNWVMLCTILLIQSVLADTHLTAAESAPIANTPEYVIIRSNNQITFSSETAASVAKILVKEGSNFSTGDILLELDCRVQQAELN